MKLVHLTESDELNDTLLKIRKGSFAGFNKKKLEMVLGALNWGVTDRISAILQKRCPGKIERELAGTDTRVRFDGVYKDVPESQFYITVSKYYREDDEREKAKAAVEAVHAKIKALEVPEPVESPKKNKFFYWDLGHVVEEKFPSNGAEFKFKFRLSYSTEVLSIKAPNGKEFIFGKIDSVSENMNDFISWATKETSLKQEVLDYLGMESHEAAKKAERTRENTGTCGVCGHEQKLKNGKTLVLHGYQRPGHGYIVGDCFGVGYQPWEKSKEAVVDYIKALEKMLKQRTEQLGKFENGEVKSLHVKDRSGKIVQIAPGDKGWEAAVNGNIQNLKNEIRYIGQDIAMYEGRVEKWEEQDLPWDKIQKHKAAVQHRNTKGA